MKTKGISVLVKAPAAGQTNTDKALDNLRRVVDSKRTILDGARVLEDVVLTTTAFTRIAHGLGRRPQGYFLARVKTAPGAAFSLYDDNDNRTDADRFLYLRTVGASVTANVVVY